MGGMGIHVVDVMHVLLFERVAAGMGLNSKNVALRSLLFTRKSPREGCPSSGFLLVRGGDDVEIETAAPLTTAELEDGDERKCDL